MLVSFILGTGSSPANRICEVSESEPCTLTAVHLYCPRSDAVGRRIWSPLEPSQENLQTNNEDLMLCLYSRSKKIKL